MGRRSSCGMGQRDGFLLQAQARMGQPGTRRWGGRPPAQAPDICVSAAATVSADGSGYTLALPVGWSQGPQATERESEPESEREPWAAKPPAPGRRSTAQAEEAEPRAQVGSLRERRGGSGSRPRGARDPRISQRGVPGERDVQVRVAVRQRKESERLSRQGTCWLEEQ